MHALVNQGNGKYYVSYVFGYYTDITATDEYERYVQSIHSPYFIVWDENKQKLIKWLRMVPNTNYLIQQIIIVDRNRDNWIIDDEGEGCVNFLSKEIIDSIVKLKYGFGANSNLILLFDTSKILIHIGPVQL